MFIYNTHFYYKHVFCNSNCYPFLRLFCKKIKFDYDELFLINSNFFNRLCFAFCKTRNYETVCLSQCLSIMSIKKAHIM